MKNPFENDNDDQVVQRAAGGANRGTIEEMTRRLKASIDLLDNNISGLRSSIESGQSTAERISRRILVLTIALFFLGVVQLAILIYQIFWISRSAHSRLRRSA
jgi:hypothetical protein